MEKCFVVWRGVGSLCEISNHDSPPTTIIYLMEDIIAIMTSDDTLKLVVIHFSFRIIEYEINYLLLLRYLLLAMLSYVFISYNNSWLVLWFWVWKMKWKEKNIRSSGLRWILYRLQNYSFSSRLLIVNS